MSQTNIGALATQPEIPSGSELVGLAQSLQERKSTLVRRRANAEADKRNVLGGHVHASDLGRTPLPQLYDQSTLSADRIQEHSSRSARDSPNVSPLNEARNLPSSTAQSSSSSQPQGKARASGLARSPPPLANHASAGSATGSGNPTGSSLPGRPRIKVKRESERDREPSVVSATGSHALGDSDAASPGIDADWDDEGGPSRPGRAFKRKRQHHASALDNDSDMSLSEAESPEPGSLHFDAQRPGLPHVSTSSSSTAKLKLNPTAQTAPPRRDSLGSNLLRKASGLRGDLPLTPYQAQLAAQWELPRRTLETIVPKKAQTRARRSYPTRPDDVDVDYSAMDWRERDRERDRIESGGVGPSAGQSLVKESTATGRARDRKQDQVPHHIFQQWVEGWFRTLTEEDLAWLSSKTSDLEPFQTPALGRHYSEVWAEEEAQELPMQTIYLPGSRSTITPFVGARPPQNNERSGKLTGENSLLHTHEASRFDPRKLRDENLTTAAAEDARAGPITERLLSAVLPQRPLPQPTDTTSSVSTGGGGLVLVNGHGSGNAGPSQDLSMFEQRLANELKAIEVLSKDQKLDWSDRTDDEVSVALRKVQRLLREQTRQNEQKKAVLFQIAMERMAYQEYLGCLASVEREIESGWLKRQTQIKKSMQAQKKKKGSNGNNSGNSTSATNVASGSGNAVAAAAAMGVQVGVPSPAPGTPGATGMAVQGSSQGAVGTPGGPASSATHAAGGGPIKPQFSEALIGAMQRRLQLKYALEPLFASKPLAKYTPTESIYADSSTTEAIGEEGGSEPTVAEFNDEKQGITVSTPSASASISLPNGH